MKIRSPCFHILIFIISIYPYFVFTFEFCPPYRFPGFLTYLKIPVLGIPDQLHFAVVLDAGLRGRGSSDHPKNYLSLSQYPLSRPSFEFKNHSLFCSYSITYCNQYSKSVVRFEPWSSSTRFPPLLAVVSKHGQPTLRSIFSRSFIKYVVFLHDQILSRESLDSILHCLHFNKIYSYIFW